TRSLPATVRGPVECSQGRAAKAASRSRSRPSGVNGPRKAQFRRPALTRFGLGEGVLASTNVPPNAVAVTCHFAALALFRAPGGPHSLGRARLRPGGRGRAAGRARDVRR